MRSVKSCNKKAVLSNPTSAFTVRPAARVSPRSCQGRCAYPVRGPGNRGLKKSVPFYLVEVVHRFGMGFVDLEPPKPRIEPR